MRAEKLCVPFDPDQTDRHGKMAGSDERSAIDSDDPTGNGRLGSE